MSTFYITTPIYYVNGEPHLGHAYTTIVADVMARHYRQRGYDVFFMTGTDEHGIKVQREAEAQGITPQELADRNSTKFRELFDHLRLTHDRFIRTTEADHARTVTEVVKRMKANGDIYLGSYSGWYSAADEAFYDESEIEDGRHKEFGSEVEWVEESSYFFKLSAYEQKLLDWYQADDDHVRPDARRNEVRAFVEGGLKDLSISRTTFDWGIDWPDDPEHVLYVWVDALTNYITGVGAFQDDGRFERYWPCDIHLIGKDILRFHAVYWPAFLMSAGIDPPKQVFAHGWWTIEGEKMSKRSGNFVDPYALADEWDLDVVRYFLLREIPLGSDGDFSRLRVAERNNAELADNLGNLVNRSLAMTRKFLDGVIPGATAPLNEADAELAQAAQSHRDALSEHMDHRDTHKAVDAVLSFGRELNGYIQRSQPWKLAKDDSQAERLREVMYTLLEGIRWVAVMASAFLPDTADRILQGLEVNGADRLAFSTLTWGGLQPAAISEVPVLFAKFDLEELAASIADEAPTEETPREDDSADEGTPLIDFPTFLQVEMKVAKIVHAERVDGADKLLRLEADVGEAAPRQIVAGIAKSFAPEDLVGRCVAVVTNLQPRKLFGLESQAMLLAAENSSGGLTLTQFADDVAPGTRIS